MGQKGSKYKASNGLVKKRQALKNKARVKYYRNTKKGKNPHTGLEYYLLQPHGHGSFKLVDTYQTRAGAEQAKGEKKGLMIYESKKIEELMFVSGDTYTFLKINREVLV